MEFEENICPKMFSFPNDIILKFSYEEKLQMILAIIQIYSFIYLGGKEGIKLKNINLYYWNGAPNFGDQLNIDICRNIFNVDPICVSPNECEAAFVGSLLDDFLCDSKESELYQKYFEALCPVEIWGAGFIAGKNKFLKRPYYKPEFYFRKISLRAVRGKKSLKRLEKIFNRKFPDAVLGDPGLLISELLNHSVHKRYRMGIIPHHLEKKDDVYNNISIKNSLFIDIEAPIREILHNIAECEIIASASLHGLIAADSLGIPNGRLIASNKILGGNYKFEDYDSSLNFKRPAFDIRKRDFTEADINKIADYYRVDPEQIAHKKEALINSFPYR